MTSQEGSRRPASAESLESYHYPPELLSLLIDTIPLLCRSKRDVLQFFRGAGVSQQMMMDLAERVNSAAESISKYEIARTILTRLNEQGDKCLGQRREVLKRVSEFEDFSVCWPNDQLKAKGAVAEVRRIINVKDSFTRMAQEREREAQERLDAKKAAEGKRDQQRAALADSKLKFFALFSESDPTKRGRKLELVLNDLFKASGLLVREAFALMDPTTGGVLEQIDGVVEIDGEIYLVEMKWTTEKVDRPEVASHLVRIFGRGCARGIFISGSAYTQAAVQTCREALQRTVVVLCDLQEIVRSLEGGEGLDSLLRAKIREAIIAKNPYHRPGWTTS